MTLIVFYNHLIWNRTPSLDFTTSNSYHNWHLMDQRQTHTTTDTSWTN